MRGDGAGIVEGALAELKNDPHPQKKSVDFAHEKTWSIIPVSWNVCSKTGNRHSTRSTDSCPIGESVNCKRVRY